jgi:hypothetical protein
MFTYFYTTSVIKTNYTWSKSFLQYLQTVLETNHVLKHIFNRTNKRWPEDADVCICRHRGGDGLAHGVPGRDAWQALQGGGDMATLTVCGVCVSEWESLVSCRLLSSNPVQTADTSAPGRVLPCVSSWTAHQLFVSIVSAYSAGPSSTVVI